MSQLSPTIYQTKSPVLFTIFNRPDVTLKVFEQIKLAKPPRLYIAADGPRPGKPEDVRLCKEARNIINLIDWECEVKTLFKENNAGCRNGMSSAVTWFFSQEEEGIILEDDCLPANSFFRFCDVVLERYRNDSRIRHITGCNLQDGRKWGNASYYFSNMTHVWGWASWRRVWDEYQDLPRFNESEVREKLVNIFTEPMLVESWFDIFTRYKQNQINSWGYQLDFVNFFNNGLTIIPNVNLISNIGFREDATHTIQSDSVYADMPVEELGEITHPVFILPEKNADAIVLNRDFNVDARKRKQNAWHRKVKRWFKEVVKNAAL
ncbi:MAG: nucleotide-diphospho-sugar transferase [Mucilaginibacter sp.]